MSAVTSSATNATNTIKSIYFDLDGTLVDTKHFHYIALNRALEDIDSKFVISPEEHTMIYDGLSTSQKLSILSEKKGLDRNVHSRVWELKQKYTNELIDSLQPDDRLIHMLKTLKSMDYTIYVVSNAIFTTVKNTLLRKGFMPYVDYFASNDEITMPKPHPEIYQKCLIRNKIYPSECLAVEDSPIGKTSATNAGCHLLSVNNPDDLTIEKVMNELERLNKLPRMTIKNTTKMNVIIPMSGQGSRFKTAGYTFPKPLIEVHGKPMIQVVVDNLNCDPKCCKFIYIVQESHYIEYNLKYLLNLITPGCEIVRTSGMTEGSTCSVLLAREFIDNDTPLMMANSDQFLEWNNHEFIYSMVSSGVDGGISTFTATHPKWSFAKVDDKGFVTEVAEKKPISDIATTGIYYWKNGSDFVKYADQMIAKNIRTNGEFYICPVFNEAIADGKKIRVSSCKRMWGIGIPEDLRTFLDEYKGSV